jgi:hypothetical protein
MEKIKSLSYMNGDDDDESDHLLDEEQLGKSPKDGHLESEMDLVSARSNSVFENEALKEKYNHSNHLSPFKLNADCFDK